MTSVDILNPAKAFSHYRSNQERFFGYDDRAELYDPFKFLCNGNVDLINVYLYDTKNI
jgi:hypothetical protein